MFDGAELGKEIVALVKGYVERQNAALITRIEALEKAIAEERAKPKGMAYRGVHQRAMSYAQGDAVTHAGALWVALRAVEPGQKPGESDSWQLAAKGGER